MKRAAVGGAHRGPVGLGRQRRTLRLVQAILVAIAVGLLLFAGYSLGQRSAVEGSDTAFDATREPPLSQTIVLALLGVGSFVGALLLQGESGIRLPTPARLEDLAGRAERVALERAADAAKSRETEPAP